MKLARFSILLFYLLAAIPILVQAKELPSPDSSLLPRHYSSVLPNSPLATHPEWFECQNDEDCTFVTGGGNCGAVNKKHATQLDQLLSEKYSMLPNHLPCVGDRGMTLTCHKNVCVTSDPLL